LVVEHGCTVHAVSRNAEALRMLAEECGSGPGEFHAVPLDIGAPGAAAELAALLDGARVHGLLHNAGVLLRGELGGYSREALEEVMRINVVVPLELTQALAPLLAGDPPGHVVSIGSMGGFQDSVKFPGLIAYSASKAALACMAQCLAEEFKDQGIRSNCLALGAVDTEMLRAAFPGYQATMSAGTMGRHVAAFILDGHNFYNGKVLPVAVSTP
jgi:NAD(P)-dependent dehydrogenase (short-subunit alcohol dehydrogenase family)